MELTCKVDYALVALVELATHYTEGRPLKVGEIAKRQGVSDRYLDQILATLRRIGILQSQRGAKGGYLLARSPREINLLDILLSVEGTSNPKVEDNSQFITIEKTAVLSVWQKVTTASHEVLKSITLEDLCQQRDAYQQKEPMFYI